MRRRGFVGTLMAVIAAPKALVVLHPTRRSVPCFPWGDSPTAMLWLHDDRLDYAQIGTRYLPPPVAPKTMLSSSETVVMFEKRLTEEELGRAQRSLGYPKVVKLGGFSS